MEWRSDAPTQRLGLHFGSRSRLHPLGERLDHFYARQRVPDDRRQPAPVRPQSPDVLRGPIGRGLALNHRVTGTLFTLLVGFLVDHFSYFPAFVLAATAPLLATLSVVFLIRRSAEPTRLPV